MRKTRPTDELVSIRREAHLRTVGPLYVLSYINERSPEAFARQPWLRAWIRDATSSRTPPWYTSDPTLCSLAAAVNFLHVPIADLCASPICPFRPQPDAQPIDEHDLVTCIRNRAFVPIIKRSLAPQCRSHWNDLNPPFSAIIRAAYLLGVSVDQILRDGEEAAVERKNFAGEGFDSRLAYAQNSGGDRRIPIELTLPPCPE